MKKILNLKFFIALIFSLFTAIQTCSATGSVDTQSPSAPEGLTAINKTYTSISLSWKASHDNIGVKGYQLFRDGKKIITTSKTSYTNTDLIPGRKYSYYLKAYDAAGNVSENSMIISVTPLTDLSVPSIPGSLSVLSSGCTTVTIGWEPSKDNVGIKGYEIYINGTKKATTSATSYICKSLLPGLTYNFSIKAYDTAGNYSGQSNIISAATLADTEVPTIPCGIKAVSATATEINLTWNPSSDNVKVKGYEIFFNGSSAGKSSKPSFTAANLQPGKSYSVSICAYDSTGNNSGKSTSLTVTTQKDVQAPTAPSGLIIKSIKGTSVSLSWNASSDNAKVAGYRVYCNGVELTVTTRTSCTIKCSGIFGINIIYVKAYDLVNNLSSDSNSVTALIF
ncbi:MAG: fibronectin type III domain-containing protein [Bacillota bacterium]|nr:fibronectin type III domain-containing protein [Bacillota bacterium]